MWMPRDYYFSYEKHIKKVLSLFKLAANSDQKSAAALNTTEVNSCVFTKECKPNNVRNTLVP